MEGCDGVDVVDVEFSEGGVARAFDVEGASRVEGAFVVVVDASVAVGPSAVFGASGVDGASAADSTEIADAPFITGFAPSGAPTTSFAGCVRKYVDTGAGPVCAMWKGRRLGSAVGSLRTSQVVWMERDIMARDLSASEGEEKLQVVRRHSRGWESG